MPRPVVVFAGLATVGALAGLAYLHASRTDPAGEPVPRASLPITDERAAPSSGAMPAVEEGNSRPSANPTESTRLATPASVASTNVAQWIADTRSDDAKKRAAAIAALASAPKAQAIPALEYVVESGEPQVDQQIALQSLHALAMNDGDSDGAIRDVIRKALYHSDDEGVTQNAQALLEDIEAEFAEREPDAEKSPPGEHAK